MDFHRYLYAVFILGVWLFGCPGAGGPEAFAESRDEAQELRERLTEREDENRVENPYQIRVFNRPLSLLGQYEIALDVLERMGLGETAPAPSRTLLEQEVEGEAFYLLHENVSLFLQFRVLYEEDLDSETAESLSDLYLERGEMWFFAENLADSGLSVEAGRLEFEDDRTWWWDEELDAVRLTLETDWMEISTAAARELLPVRLDDDDIEPEQEDVFRTLTEFSADWSEDHAIELFVLTQRDHSDTEAPGERLRLAREDESDADLVWFGARLAGAVEMEAAGLVGYWAEAAWVRGDEDLVSLEEADEEEDETQPPPPGRGRVEEVESRQVRGWALDTGLTWLLPLPAEPRLTLGYARGSGDARPESQTDRGFRQTGLQGNEPGFGGVQRFQRYGGLLDPELSNLSIISAGLGVSFWKNSSLDLVFHHYQLVEKTDTLRDARIDAELTGEDRALGQGFDVILAMEEWQRVELEFSAAAFRADRAFGSESDEWILGGYAAFRYAF